MKKIFSAIVAGALLCACSSASTKVETAEEAPHVLVAYFSATGTTANVAQALAEAIGADLQEIAPAEPYTGADLDWRDKESRSSIEMADSLSRPALADAPVDLAAYDTIYVGYPIWWYTCPRIINTWVESNDLAGKTVVPFATSGGSTIEKSVDDLRAAYPDVNWADGKLLNGGASQAAEWAKASK